MKIAILISGGGTTMEQVALACQNGALLAQVVLVIANKDSAGGLLKAKKLGLPTKVLRLKKDFNGDRNSFGEAIIDACHEAQADMIAQLGWLALTPVNVIQAFTGMIINQHPGPLDPGRSGFGGQGMHGLTVHQAVIQFSGLIQRPFLTEATVHRVTENYDEGVLLGTKPLKILPEDTAESLAQRLLPLEHALVIETLMRFASGQVVEISRAQPLIKPDEELLLKYIKKQLIPTKGVVT